MRKTIRARVLDHVTDYYLSSDRFNGTACPGLAVALGLTVRQLLRAVRELVRSGDATLEFGDRHPNPHIKAVREEPGDVQLAGLAEWEQEYWSRPVPEVALSIPATDYTPPVNIAFDTPGVCVYPSPSQLARVVNQAAYAGRPFTYRLALGEPQLAFETFDLSVLEHYRNDPRYSYQHGDMVGRIYAAEDPPRQLPESDQVCLAAFGFAYQGRADRVVAAWLWDLSCLSAEHQQLWNAKRIAGDYKLHPDFHRCQILGEWPDYLSLFDAFIEEVQFLNAASGILGRRPLFKGSLTRETRPRGFGYLIRPTLSEFNGFVHLLDKLLSDSIDVGFFRGEVAVEVDVPRAGGKVEVQRRGSLKVMDAWLRSRYSAEAATTIDALMAPLCEVRRLRQKPAHAIEDDQFDRQVLSQQLDLMESVVRALSTLCAMFLAQEAVQDAGMAHPLEGRNVWAM